MEQNREPEKSELSTRVVTQCSGNTSFQPSVPGQLDIHMPKNKAKALTPCAKLAPNAPRWAHES